MPNKSVIKILTIANKSDAQFLSRKVPATDIKKLDKKTASKLIQEMKATMRAAAGIGLSANQVGLNTRLFVAEVPSGRGSGMKFYAVFNPEIIRKSTELLEAEEGCLSVPDVFGQVERAEKIAIKGLDVYGKPIKIKAWGLLARVFQHETDHLNGKLFIEMAKKTHKLKAKTEN